MNRRNKTQIYLDILLAIRRESGRLKKTHIVYKANLTNTRVQPYLEFLLSKGFVEEVKGRETFYTITDKGQNFLGQVNKLKEISDAFGLPIV
jgi:predicted transcriptional regulator